VREKYYYQRTSSSSADQEISAARPQTIRETAPPGNGAGGAVGEVVTPTRRQPTPTQQRQTPLPARSNRATASEA